MKRLRNAQRGFTLIELLLATLIMAVIIAAVYSTWNSSLAALKRARDLTENLQRQRALLDVLGRSFRTALFSQENADWYVWETEDLGDADTLSFVATHVPVIGGPTPSDPMPQRIQFSLEPGDDGRMVLLARVKNYLAMDVEETDRAVELADWVKTFNLRYYDAENDEMVDYWENTEAMPAAVEITLTMASSDPTAQSEVTLTKLMQIPTTATAQLGPLVDEGGGGSTQSGPGGQGGQSGPSGQGGRGSSGGGGERR
jgi:general secretion pathway protein J